jgi:hypothetical protein
MAARNREEGGRDGGRAESDAAPNEQDDSEGYHDFTIYNARRGTRGYGRIDNFFHDHGIYGDGDGANSTLHRRSIPEADS